jgi:hypothetical protein
MRSLSSQGNIRKRLLVRAVEEFVGEDETGRAFPFDACRVRADARSAAAPR